MITQEFDFHAPRRLDEVLRLLADNGEGAKLLAGGMSLVPMMTLGLVQPRMVVSLNHVAGLAYVREDAGALVIGAGTTHAEVARDPLIARHCPLLADAARHIGDVQVRNRGTIGGSLAHADPAADYLPVMAVVGARMIVRGVKDRREIPADAFFTGLMQTAVGPQEMLVEIAVPKTQARGAYRRLHRIEGNFAIVNAAAMVEGAGGAARVAIGGVGHAPVVLDVSAQMRGGASNDALNAIAGRVYEATAGAPEDLNATAEYRRRMASVYARRALAAAAV
ncbi:MAG TPA: xanthine dehydrogenase family protein subunit M [Candidatus Binataceae bacterium]|jgi:carbon-monoxide dehydrogenase medium subunit|nr:xanthine dehydrogenase family protein subunit M [Candidatus Binataceae bacterium]